MKFAGSVISNVRYIKTKFEEKYYTMLCFVFDTL